MKIIKQHDERDCGAACLSIIASHYKLKYPISKYRELTKTDQNGANLYGLCDAAQKIGFQADALSGNMEEDNITPIYDLVMNKITNIF